MMTPDAPALSDPNGLSDRSLLRRVTHGQESAAEEIHRRYANRILALARSQLPSCLLPRADADDVAQSVFRAFFDQARQGFYEVPDGESLWQLLAVVTINKVRALRAHHARQRRDFRTTQFDAPDLGTDSTIEAELVVRDVLNRLSSVERTAIQLRLDGYEVSEIADRIGRSKRSVERVLQHARQSLLEFFDND